MMAFLLLAFFLPPINQPEEQDSLARRIEITGYLKGLSTTDFAPKFRNPESFFLIHNRLKLRYRPTPSLSLNLDMRNRLYLGEGVLRHPARFSDFSYPGEYMSIRSSWMHGPRAVGYSNIDRLWGEYRSSQWHVRLGRQRINWGICTVWNPNDLFNTFNFLDVDYEERPASDGILVGRTFGATSSLEGAAAITRSREWISAARYYHNVRETDLYLLAGWYLNQPTAGVGWSGYWKEFGWKGEVQYFIPFDEVKGIFNLDFELDRIFPNNWYGAAGLLFNQSGVIRNMGLLDMRTLSISPRLLMPSRWNTLVLINKEFTPLVSGVVNLIWSPGTDLIFFLPGLKVNLTRETDLDIIGQSFLIGDGTRVREMGHRLMVRIKWNF